MVASCNGDDQRCKVPYGRPDKLDWETAVLYEDIQNAPGDTDVLTTKTMVHEVGHVLGVERNDDGSIARMVPQEVYSGNSDDGTPETVEFRNFGRTDEWSAMSSGWEPTFNSPPSDGQYIAFSVEELFTIEFKEIETRDE